MKRKLSIRKCLLSVVLCSLGAVTFAATVGAQTGAPTSHPQMPHAPNAGRAVASSSASSIAPQVTNGGNPRSIQLPDAALERQMVQLERAKHLLEISSVNEPAGHKAVAARHLQSAINELKMEMKEHAKAKHAGKGTQAASAATPGIRR
jgi:hypothetical protein